MSFASGDDDDDDLRSPLQSSALTNALATDSLRSKPKLTKAQRKALKSGASVGPARKNGETDFVGRRKEIFDAHLQNSLPAAATVSAAASSIMRAEGTSLLSAYMVEMISKEFCASRM
uniref:Ribosome biogenesis protein SLX9 n=1 Tax=Mycena chlorophos TaxID=658473 RepID=A0ABQ0LE60_MYCCL|nr:predicted protein [Mycena chlorophos]